MGTPPFFAGGVEPPTKFSKRGGLTGPQLLEGGDFFQGGCNFHIKNKLKSEIFNDKSLEANNCSNWEILPKSLVTFKR